MPERDHALEEAALRADGLATMKAMIDTMARLIELLEQRTPMFAQVIELLERQQEILTEWTALVPRIRDHERIPAIHEKLSKLLHGTLKDSTEQDRLAAEILSKLDLICEQLGSLTST